MASPRAREEHQHRAEKRMPWCLSRCGWTERTCSGTKAPPHSFGHWSGCSIWEAEHPTLEVAELQGGEPAANQNTLGRRGRKQRRRKPWRMSSPRPGGSPAVSDCRCLRTRTPPGSLRVVALSGALERLSRARATHEARPVEMRQGGGCCRHSTSRPGGGTCPTTGALRSTMDEQPMSQEDNESSASPGHTRDVRSGVVKRRLPQTHQGRGHGAHTKEAGASTSANPRGTVGVHRLM